MTGSVLGSLILADRRGASFATRMTAQSDLADLMKILPLVLVILCVASARSTPSG